MRFMRKLAIALIATMLLAVAVSPAMTQDDMQDATPILILPTDQAQFLPGSIFDMRVEVHVSELPEDFAVTINGTDATEFFGVEPEEQSWSFGGNVGDFIAAGEAPEGFNPADLSGNFYNDQFGTAIIIADPDTNTFTIEAAGDIAELELTDDVLLYNVIGGAADGQALVFGLDENGVVSGFSVAGFDFGVLNVEPIPVQSLFWNDVTLMEPGEYTVEVTAGGTTEAVNWTVREPAVTAEAQNVILFIADGGSAAVYTAARLISRGMDEGRYNDLLSWDNFEEVGLIHTSGLDSIMTDSANSASAYNTGHKSAVNATGVYPDTSEDPYDDPRVETLAEIIRRTTDKAIGVVTNSEFVDATPAAVWAHSRARNTATRSAYALQLLDLMPEVIMGGGAAYLLPQSIEGSNRRDDNDLFTMYEEAGYTVVTSATELADSGTPEMLAGFFHPGNMDVWLDRNVFTENLGPFTDQPGLVDMTIAALDVLTQNESGFYLQVEASSVDKALHPMDFDRALADTIEMDRAVAATLEYLEANGMLENTLIIVTSDHAHSFDVYGTVDVEAFNAGETDLEKRAAIGIYADAGFPTYTDEDGDYFPDSWDVDRTLAMGKVDYPDFTEDFQVSPVYRTPAVRNDEGVYVDNPEDDPNGITMTGNLPPGASTSVHTLQDIPVFATGPGAGGAGRVIDNTELFFVMANALGLDPRAAMMAGN